MRIEGSALAQLRQLSAAQLLLAAGGGQARHALITPHAHKKGRLAEEILKATGAAIAQINGAIDTAVIEIRDVTAAEMNHIETHGVLTGEALQTSRDNTMVTIFNQLQDGSQVIQEATRVIQDHFDAQLPAAEQSILEIPDTGTGTRLPAPGGGESGGTGGESGAGTSLESSAGVQ